MAPRGHARCGICNSQESKYTCPSCLIPYCSVSCYKKHKRTSCSDVERPAKPLNERDSLISAADQALHDRQQEEDLPDAKPLRSLTSLKWPYIPEETAYPDPLKRDDPKPLQLHHYKTIASSPKIRSILSSNPTLPALLRKLDELRGTEREETLERLLGVANDRSMRPSYSRRGDIPEYDVSEDEAKILKQLAGAVENVVRGDKPDLLGLDWTDEG